MNLTTIISSSLCYSGRNNLKRVSISIYQNSYVKEQNFIIWKRGLAICTMKWNYKLSTMMVSLKHKRIWWKKKMRIASIFFLLSWFNFFLVKWNIGEYIQLKMEPQIRWSIQTFTHCEISLSCFFYVKKYLLTFKHNI